MWDVAEHVVIALRVLKEMDLEPTMFDAFLQPEHAYNEVLVARLRAELGFPMETAGFAPSDVDITWHVWRLLEVTALFACNMTKA